MLLEDIKQEVDKDIAICAEEWDNFSYDTDKMTNLFNRVLFKYKDSIEGFSTGMVVISNYEDNNIKGETLRKNILKIIERLKIFKENGYKNDGMVEAIISHTNVSLGIKKYSSENFSSTREYISLMNIAKLDKTELLAKLDEIEEICKKVEYPELKWDKLRPYIVWLSGKGLEISIKFLPLFQLIG